MSADRLARALRVRAAATRGIRAVPENPDPDEFPRVLYACDVRPVLCEHCTTYCNHPLGRPRL